jgi:probable rRNA maturation factor
MASRASGRRPSGGARLAVTVTSPDGHRAPTRGLRDWLTRVAPASARGEVTVALVSDRRMRALNRSFRGKDAPTDVLSFPVVPGEDPLHAADRSLGDIVIAAGIAARQAKAAGHALGTELRVLALHGLLHLLGYDHETDDGRMARAEARLRKKGGLEAGLIARSPTRTSGRATPRGSRRR